MQFGPGIDEERSVDGAQDARGHAIRQHHLVGQQSLAGIRGVPRAAGRRPVGARRKDNRRERGVDGQARQLVWNEERLAPPVVNAPEHRVRHRNQVLPVCGQETFEGVERGIARPSLAGQRGQSGAF